MNQLMHPYTYSVLSFTPDIRTGEFINVGIAAFSAPNKLASYHFNDKLPLEATTGDQSWPKVNFKKAQRS